MCLPSALLRLRMAAAALDKVLDATLDEPFARPGALNPRAAPPADWAPTSTRLDVARAAATLWMPRRACWTATLRNVDVLDVVRLMKRRRRAETSIQATGAAPRRVGPALRRRQGAGRAPVARRVDTYE